MSLLLENIAAAGRTDLATLSLVAQRNQDAIKQQVDLLRPCVRNFVDATVANVVFTLPAGTIQRDYFVVKIDGSGNTVTVTAIGTDTINGVGTFVLNAQYKKVTLTWYAGVWYVVAS